MSLARFFIDRPIFAAVISILITLAGALSAFTLPIAQYPPIAPPTIQVDCNYPGASAQVVAETIAAPIEQRVNGVEGMMYMNSQSTSDGSYTLTITFETGTELNFAQVAVQNRVNLALPELPDVVRATGVTTRKRSPELTLTISLNSPDERYDQLYLSNYSVTRLRDELSRIHGISDVTIFGQQDYSMRIWIDPDKLAACDLTALDVLEAVRGQNTQVPLGRIGAELEDNGRLIQAPMRTVGRLKDEKQYEEIILKATADGKLIRLREVAKVELGARSQDVANRFDRKPTIGLAIFLLSDANALEVGDQVKAKMAELGKDLPEGVKYEVGYDTTPFIRESIVEVFKALRDSIILVAIVVLVFLQSWRAALIPLAAVPVAIVGTFAAMSAVGFGINNLTLFGLVLAVGIVVDDAIVVVEAVQHQLEKGIPPREATIRAMEDVSGPIIAVGAVLVAVFIPCAFLTGIVGEFFRQFALTIAISTIISTFNSLTLSPALSAILLQPKAARQDLLSRCINLLFGWFFRIFDRLFDLLGRGYLRSIRWLIRIPILALFVYVGLLSLTSWGYQQMPTGFIPQQDKGYLIASFQLPDAASAERTRETIDKVATICLRTKGVKHVNAVAGNSFVLSAYGSNFGSMFIILDDFPDRKAPDLYADAIAAKLRKEIEREVPGAQITIFGAPAVSRLGRAGGIKMMVEDRGDLGPRFLQGQTENLIDKGNVQPGLVGLSSVHRTNSPQIYVDVDHAACSTQGIDIRDVYATMQATLGSRYVNDFNRFDRTWQVNVQASPQFRNSPDDIRKLKVRSRTTGKLIPIGAIAKVKEVTGPLVLTRYNMYSAAALSGNVAPGHSSGDAMNTLEKLADQELPERMSYEWTELAFIEKRSRNTGIYIFLFSVAVVFLVLAALYESWALPFAVILVVPVCVSCSLAGVYLTNLDVSAQLVSALKWLGIQNPKALAFPGKAIASIGTTKQDVNIFTQVGFVVLIGLACKNAILIVEYAKRQRDSGVTRREAILSACRLRFRPILMTSFAFILGVTPLMYAHGAGAEMRTALGIAVFSGMLGVTVFGVFLTPAFFVLVDWLKERRLLHSRTLHGISSFVFWILTVGFIRSIVKYGWKKLTPPARKQPIA